MTKPLKAHATHSLRRHGDLGPAKPMLVERTPSVPAPTFLRLNSPKLIGAEFDQLIGAAAELGGVELSWRTVPSFAGASIVWLGQAWPADAWLRDLERELHTFATVNGLTVAFYRG